jgi:polysaccharide chain length determinant protein (PEP-CTERM system associated)
MEEMLEEQGSEGLSLHRYLEVLRRRYLQFLIPLFLGWLLVWGASWVLPVRYKSGTLILVEQPTMPKNYVQPNVSEDLQARMASIQQQILSRTRLLLIIDKLHLYPSTHAEKTADQKVEMMRKDIEIELVRATEAAPITAFKIYYSAHDPHVAQQVTSELTDLFINENLKVRQQQSQDTTAFITSQLENARATLAEQEAKIREFEGAHVGELPSQQASNLQILSGLQSELQNEQGSLNSAKQQKVYLQTLLDQFRSLHGTPRGTEGSPPGLAAIDSELAQLRSKLANLTTHYTDQYPAVEALKGQIAKTEKMRADITARSTATTDSSKQAVDGGVTDISQTATPLQLQSQLKANEAEITNREQAIADLKARIGSYQTRLNQEPTREQQLANLTRGYTQSKTNFDDLLKKKNDSEMATSMEQMQQGERFTMLDPPSLPTKPDFPNRLNFCGIGLGVGLALGLAVVAGFEALDDRIYDEAKITALLTSTVIGEIPEVVHPEDERKSKNRVVLSWAMTAMVLLTILAGSAYSFLRG